MNKEKDYLDKIEEDRQEVELDEVSRRRTRTRSSRKQNNAPKITGIKFLVVIFIFIPLTLLGYVWLFYEPEVKTAAPEVDNTIVHIEKNDSSASSPSVGVEEDESDKNEEQDSSNESSDVSIDNVEVNEEEQQAIDQAAAAAEQALKEQQQQQEQANQQSPNTANAKKHLVQVNDTLYSIAMKYYKDPTKVDAIKRANNLSSDSIPLGQELILP